MISQSTHELDSDLLTFLEDIFNVRIADDDAKYIVGPLKMEEWLALHMPKQRPTPEAAELLRLLAEVQHRPELAEDLDGSWRREQISALVRDIFRECISPMELHEMLSQPPLQRFGEPSGSTSTATRGWRKLLPTKSSMAIFTTFMTLILLYQFLK